MPPVGAGATGFSTWLGVNVGIFSVARPSVSSDIFLTQRRSAQFLKDLWFHQRPEYGDMPSDVHTIHICRFMIADEVEERAVVLQFNSNCGFPCRHRNSCDLRRVATARRDDAEKAQRYCKAYGTVGEAEHSRALVSR